jgi:hypothetical protein
MRSRMACAGAAFCLAVSVLSVTSARAEGSEPLSDAARLEEAKRHMKAGASFYNDPRGHKCEEALREFGKAYQLSGSLNAIKGMAICDLELERDGDSIERYSAYLKGKGDLIDPAERAQIEADLNTLRASVASIRLSANRAGVHVTDVRTPTKGYAIRNVYTLTPAGKTLGIHPGQHVFTASAEGLADQTWGTEIVNGSAYEHAFVFAEATAPAGDAGTRPVPASVYATLGLTVGLAVPWAILAVRAKNQNDAYTQANGMESTTASNALRSDVRNANLLADIFLGATLASLTATAVLLFTRPTKPAKAGTSTMGDRPRAPAPVVGIAPRIGVSSGGAVVSGWF